MKIWTLIPLMLLAMQSALPGQDAAALMRKGEDALSSGIWEMAALHFNKCLAMPGLAPAAKSQAALRLAESWVREGKHAEALDLLGRSFVVPGVEAAFWKGQALLGTGRFMESLETLSPLADDASAPCRNEAAFTVANLHLALGKPDAALDTLAKLSTSPDLALSAKARLHQVEILLDSDRPVDARREMPSQNLLQANDRLLAMFLEARLLLKEKRPADAVAGFQSLVDTPQGQSLSHYHMAAVGLADALRENGASGRAVDFLFSFIQEHPDSPQLEAMFARLLDSMPAALSPTDPLLERLSQWITPPEIPAPGLVDALPSDAASAWPAESPTSELLALSLYTRAVGLHRCGTPEARAESKRLMNRVRLENPDHFIAKRALFQMARWALANGAVDRAFCMLDTLRESTSQRTMRGEAAFLEARTAYQRGEKQAAVALFDEAAASLAGNEARTARLNSAVIQLIGNPDAAAPADPSLTADLELERALSTKEPAARRKALADFLSRHPEHPRAAEARLAAAESSLIGSSPDTKSARDQLNLLTADPKLVETLGASRVVMLKLRVEDLSGKREAAIATAREIIGKFPQDAVAADASLVLGRNLFQSQSYNDARLVLEKLAANDTDAVRAQAAWLLSARSAALVPTAQSQQEALILFDKAAEAKGPLVSIAMLEKARLMIDMNRLAEAAAFLRKWFDSLPPDDPLHLPAGLLLGEAIYAQGSTNPTSLTDALAVYDKLLEQTRDQPAVFNRLQYLRGRTLEQLPDEKDSSKKRDSQAFAAYYSVLETTTPPVEWHYFELCGFRALALLENAARWPAAVACARKIASFKGPRAEEAAARASQLQLKHHIWED